VARFQDAVFQSSFSKLRHPAICSMPFPSGHGCTNHEGIPYAPMVAVMQLLPRLKTAGANLS